MDRKNLVSFCWASQPAISLSLSHTFPAGLFLLLCPALITRRRFGVSRDWEKNISYMKRWNCITYNNIVLTDPAKHSVKHRTRLRSKKEHIWIFSKSWIQIYFGGTNTYELCSYWRINTDSLILFAVQGKFSFLSELFSFNKIESLIFCIWECAKAKKI